MKRKTRRPCTLNLDEELIRKLDVIAQELSTKYRHASRSDAANEVIGRSVGDQT